MTPAVLDRTQIAACIPHAGRMCLLDAVRAYDAERIVCSTGSHRHTDHPLRADGRLGIAAGIECAAQAMAVHGALLARMGQAAARPPPGFLASVRAVRFHVRWLDDVVADLEIGACRLASDAQALVYSFEVRADRRMLLEGRASVMLLPGPG